MVESLKAPLHQNGPGDDWRNAIDEHLKTADIVLLLVSANFLNSDYCHDREMEVALERHENGEGVVIPVLARHVDWEGAKFSHLQSLPTSMRPVTSWQDRDEAWTDVAKGIRRTVECLINSHRIMGDNRPSISDSPQVLEAERHVFATLEKRICQALEAKGRASPPEGVKLTYTLGQQLADIRAQKRILWVDDIPSNNAFEIAALRGLQIEVQTRTNTEDALAALEEAERVQEPYDLVLSDWNRFPTQEEGQPEGLRLLRFMRAQHKRPPVIFYHGEFDPERAKQRLELAVKEGGSGAANLPDDLLRQVAEALARTEAA
ncbi:MAG TPA: TIR domain-containing protein [Archangium sp.]|nr:TIR domain-containing protein [Archangium sp.]HYO57804.1 TIR domain-containing protein [Archangium sp.]